MSLALFFASNLRQSRASRMQFIVSGWGLRPHTPSRGFAPAPYEGALRRPPRPPACFRYFRHQLKSSLVHVTSFNKNFIKILGNHVNIL